MAPPIRVLVVDDSALMRQALGQLLSRDPAIEVVGAASDPYVARDKIRALNPDVLTLDVEMPRMDGLTFLEKLMRAHPMPVVMVSSLTEAGCETTLRALELGAVEFVTKPKLDVRERLPEVAAEIISKVKAAALARVRSRPAAGVRAPAPAAAPSLPRALRTTQKIVALGASTGGTEALKDVLSALPADSPALVIVQHMPEKFTRAFADRLDGLCTLGVKEAEDGDRVIAGHALIAPGNCHMRLVREVSMYFVRIDQEPPVNQHRPSVDVLFNSCATAAGANAVGVLMTGMGEDGARGLVAMRKAGARTLAQDEASCVVFGMPRAAVELGGAEHVVSLDAIADTVLGLTR